MVGPRAARKDRASSRQAVSASLKNSEEYDRSCF